MRYAIQNTPCGQIRGADTGKGYSCFLNIAYARAKRWEIPQEVTAWEGIYDATLPTPYCPQAPTFSNASNPTGRFYAYETVVKQVVSYSEDCQRLNIWTPDGAENAPVLVYIHGGGYMSGGSTALAYNGEHYAQKGVVAVTINYRLNIFACAVGGGHTGNYGLWDQITALQWIRNNIAAFGGDPDRITVMGESAGAMSVQNLLYSPLAKGLFHRAIMMSGGGIFPHAFAINPPDMAEKLWEEVRLALGSPSWEQMQKMPAADLFQTWSRISAEGKYITPGTPVIDGITIPDAPMTLAKTSKVNDVPTIISFLSEDMWPHTLYKIALEWGALMDDAKHSPVYGLYFDRQLPGSDDGAYHACDVRYAFGTLEYCWRPFTEIDYRISRDMMEYFIQFAISGVPAAEDLAKWVPLGKNQTQFLHFGDEPCAMVDVPEERLVNQQAKKKPFPTRD